MRLVFFIIFFVRGPNYIFFNFFISVILVYFKLIKTKKNLNRLGVNFSITSVLVESIGFVVRAQTIQIIS